MHYQANQALPGEPGTPFMGVVKIFQLTLILIYENSEIRQTPKDKFSKKIFVINFLDIK